MLIADDGMAPVRLSRTLGAGVLLRDIDVAAVVERAANREAVVAIDLDSVRGMNSDEAAADFVLDTLKIGIVMTRRAHVARRVSLRGGLGLLHALAFDSTGVARALAGSPPGTGIGTVISPGPVLAHMRAAELASLARPIVAYGLITEADDAITCLALAECVVLRQDVADSLAAATNDGAQPADTPLTPIRIEE